MLLSRCKRLRVFFYKVIGYVGEENIFFLALT